MFSYVSPQLDATLLFDALQRPDREILPRMSHCHSARLDRMLELNVITRLGDSVPTVCFQELDDFPTVHDVYLYTF